MISPGLPGDRRQVYIHVYMRPSKRETLARCSDLGLPSSTSAQHWNGIGSVPRDCWEACSALTVYLVARDKWQMASSGPCVR